MIDATKINRVYRGLRDRCMCGCTGSYHDDRKTIERQVKKMNRLISEGTDVTEDLFLDGRRAYTVNLQTRTLVAYQDFPEPEAAG